LHENITLAKTKVTLAILINNAIKKRVQLKGDQLQFWKLSGQKPGALSNAVRQTTCWPFYTGLP
jgi:hypothetical protein